MKTKLRYSRGELIAVLTLALVIIVSYVFYFFYENNPKPRVDVHIYESEFEEFVKMQQRLADSLALIGNNKYYNKYKPRADTISPSFKKQEKQQLYDIVKIDINTCDTNELTTVPQFGSKRAAKLIEYRDKLGGFYSFSQFREVYILQNIDTEKLQKYVFVSEKNIKKININTASYKELIAHPYLDGYLVKLIIKHRETKGKIADIDELQAITHAYPELIDRLRHYLCF